MTRLAVLAFAVIGLAACSKKKDDSGGLPPASKWGSQQGGGAGAAGGGGEGTAAADPTDPHAGLDMSGAGGMGDGTDPHAGLDMSGAGGTDPHAGLDMSGAGGMGDGSNPHGGGGGGMAGGRQPDPSHFLRGTLVLDPKIAGKLPANSVLFLAVKRPGASGEPEGMPVMAQLIEQYDLTKPFAFDLNESNSMMGNVPELTGEVWVLAYVDSDSNATTHLTGDLLGKAKVTVPQKDLKITIDTVLP